VQIPEYTRGRYQTLVTGEPDALNESSCISAGKVVKHRGEWSHFIFSLYGAHLFSLFQFIVNRPENEKIAEKHGKAPRIDELFSVDTGGECRFREFHFFSHVR